MRDCTKYPNYIIEPKEYITLNRRQFLFYTIACAIPGVKLPATPHELHGEKAQPAVFRIDSLRVIGEWYLRNCPNENNKKILLDYINDSFDGDAGQRVQADYASFAANLARACRYDYSREDVVFIGGWQLAVTEARLCALVAIDAMA